VEQVFPGEPHHRSNDVFSGIGATAPAGRVPRPGFVYVFCLAAAIGLKTFMLSRPSHLITLPQFLSGRIENCCRRCHQLATTTTTTRETRILAEVKREVRTSH
jgi:hypothetical protein